MIRKLLRKLKYAFLTIFLAVASAVVSITTISMMAQVAIRDIFSDDGAFFIVLRATKSAGFMARTFVLEPVVRHPMRAPMSQEKKSDTHIINTEEVLRKHLIRIKRKC